MMNTKDYIGSSEEGTEGRREGLRKEEEGS